MHSKCSHFTMHFFRWMSLVRSYVRTPYGIVSLSFMGAREIIWCGYVAAAMVGTTPVTTKQPWCSIVNWSLKHIIQFLPTHFIALNLLKPFCTYDLCCITLCAAYNVSVSRKTSIRCVIIYVLNIVYVWRPPRLLLFILFIILCNFSCGFEGHCGEKKTICKQFRWSLHYNSNNHRYTRI